MPGGTTPRAGACCVKPPCIRAPKETETTAQGEGNPVQGQGGDWRRLGAERDPGTSATAPGRGEFWGGGGGRKGGGQRSLKSNPGPLPVRARPLSPKRWAALGPAGRFPSFALPANPTSTLGGAQEYFAPLHRWGN